MIKHARLLFCILAALISASIGENVPELRPNQFECASLATEEALVDGGMDMVKGFMEAFGKEATFDDECINIAMKKNYFEVAEYLVQEYYSKDPQRGAQAESTSRNAVQQIRNKQNSLLGLFEEMVPKEIPVISPAFRWAQGLDEIFIELKYSTRFDSPYACQELFDEEKKIMNNGTALYITAICRNDKTLLKYELNLTLSEPVKDEPESYFVDQGVGRLFVNLTKDQQHQSRWKSLIADGFPKPSNMNLWWEMYEKYEKDLDALSRNYDDEDDDVWEELDEPDENGEPKEPRKKKQKKKKKVGKKGKLDKQQEPEEQKHRHRVNEFGEEL